MMDNIVELHLNGCFKAECPICGQKSKKFKDCEELVRYVIDAWGRKEIKGKWQFICPKCEEAERKERSNNGNLNAGRNNGD